MPHLYYFCLLAALPVVDEVSCVLCQRMMSRGMSGGIKHAEVAHGGTERLRFLAARARRAAAVRSCLLLRFVARVARAHLSATPQSAPRSSCVFPLLHYTHNPPLTTVPLALHPFPATQPPRGFARVQRHTRARPSPRLSHPLRPAGGCCKLSSGLCAACWHAGTAVHSPRAAIECISGA